MLKSGLQLFCYNPTTHRLIDYSQSVNHLSITTLSPGGMGTASFSLINDNLFYSNLDLFARVIILSQNTCIFIGEIMDNAAIMSQINNSLTVTAFGLGASLRDYPQTTSYINQTPQQIIIDQINKQGSYLVIDSDTSQVFPDNPLSTFSPTFINHNMEEAISEITIVAGLYSWGVWPHPTHKDSLNFPTGQLVIHTKNLTTINYIATPSDISAYTMQPSSERAYNQIAITYNDITASPPINTATYTDPRIATNTAPFRQRKYLRDMTSSTTINASQAQSIANTYGAQMQNITFKNSITLHRIHDAQGNEIPLWLATADKNIVLPNMLKRNNILSSSPTNLLNQWHIIQTTYTETPKDMTLHLQLDNYIDNANMQIARMQLASDTLKRNKSTTGTVQSSGAPEKGQCGLSLPSVNAGSTSSIAVNFKAIMTNVPTSITLTALQSTNVASTSISTITAYGFVLNIVATAANAITYYANYTTVGN